MFMSLSYVDCKPILIQQKGGDSIRFEMLLDKWLESSQIRLKESSYVKYHNLVERHIKPSLGRHPISEINNTVLNKYVAEKLKRVISTSKGLSEKTVKDILTIIKAALRFAKAESLLADVNINVILPKEKPKDMRVLSIDEQAALEKFLCSDMDESMLGIFLCLYTGLRVGEVCALMWSDICFEEGVMTVSRTMQRVQTIDANSPTKTKIIVTDPKSNFSIRTIPLPDCLLDRLKQYCPDNLHTYLLTGEAERFIEPRTYQYRFKSYFKHLTTYKCVLKLPVHKNL